MAWNSEIVVTEATFPGSTGDMTGLDLASSAPGLRRPGRRERKREAVRDRLYQTAIRLFVTHGYQATTMHEIAEDADVARATVFNHFPQKERFLDEWAARRRVCVTEILRRRRAEDLPVGDRLRMYLRELGEMHCASRRQTAVMVEACFRFGHLLHDRVLEDELARIIRNGQRRGEIRQGVDAEQVGALVAGGYFRTVLFWTAQEPAPFNLLDRLGYILDTVLNGILTAR